MNLSPFGIKNTNIFVEKSFKNLLTAFAICYQKSILANITFEKESDEKKSKLENQIRNRIVADYLENPDLMEELGLFPYTFGAEPAVIVDGKEKGLIDIKIYVYPLSNASKKSYFIFECKNLDGESALNSQYIQEGIHRFVNEKYPTTLGRNGMLGFIIKPIDIEENTQKINNLLNKSGTNAEIVAVRKQTKEHLKKYTIVNNFDFSYCSKHETLTDKKSFELYHLMLDYSNNIR